MLTIVISCTEFQNTFDKDDTENYEGLFGAEKKLETPTPSPTPTPNANPANNNSKNETNAGNVNNAVNKNNEVKTSNDKNENIEKNSNKVNAPNSNSSSQVPATNKNKKVEIINEPIGPSYEEVINQEMDPDVVSCDRRERFVILFGRKRKKVIFMKKYKDGHTKKEVKYFFVA